MPSLTEAAHSPLSKLLLQEARLERVLVPKTKYGYILNGNTRGFQKQCDTSLLNQKSENTGKPFFFFFFLPQKTDFLAIMGGLLTHAIKSHESVFQLGVSSLPQL